MGDQRPIPRSARIDKQKLADYVLAHAPAKTPSFLRRTPDGILLNLKALDFRGLIRRPTPWSLSMLVHGAMLLVLVHWAGFLPLPSAPAGFHFVSFEGSSGDGGDGREAGGSGSAPVPGPDLAGDPDPGAQPAAPAPAPAAETPPSPSPDAAPRQAGASGGAQDGSAAVLVLGGGQGASGGTLGQGHGGSGGGIFGARGGPGAGLGRGGTPASEASVALGLRWLAAHQDPSGCWSVDGYVHACPAQDPCGALKMRKGMSQYDPGVTGLALLAFLGAGQTPLHGEQGAAVGRAAEYLSRIQAPDGCFGPSFEGVMYNQGIATLALAELFAMTKDERAGAAAQRGAGFIARAQQAAGGWDYGPSQTGRNDTSVTGWQVMALKSAKAAGLKVPPETFLRAMGHFLRLGRPGGETVYADREPFGGRTGCGMTAVGLASRAFLGWPREAPAMAEGARRCLAALPGARNPEQAQGPYYWYYASMGLFQAGGEAWTRWNDVTRDFLVAGQQRRGHAAGSWEPADHFSAIGGRVTVTSLNLLTLEVYYRYLPLYEHGESSAFVENLLQELPSSAQRTLLGIAAKEYGREAALTLLRRVTAREEEGDGKGFELRLEAACRLMDLGDDCGLGILGEALLTARLSPAQALQVAARLLPSGHPKAMPMLRQALKDPNPVLRFSAVKMLEGCGDPGALALLEDLLKDPEPPVRARARQALLRLAGTAQGPAAGGAEAMAVVQAKDAPGDSWKAMRLCDILISLEPSSRDAAERASARAAYEALLAGARQAVGQGAEPRRSVDLLSRYLQELQGFRACAPGDGAEAIYLADTLARRRANCVGLSGLTLALAEDLGVPLKVVSLPTHCFLRLEAPDGARNIETTDGWRHIPDAGYAGLLEGASLPEPPFRAVSREAFLSAFLTSRGAAQGRRRDYEDALGSLNLAVSLDPSNVGALTNRAHCLKETGRREAAERDYARALEILPSWLPALMGRASCLEAWGRAEQARDLYAKAVEIHPGSVQALTCLAESLRRGGELDRALAQADRALLLDPADARANCLKGLLLYQRGDAPAAEAALRRALALEPGNGGIRTELGRLYCGARRWDEAVAQLEAALACDGDGVEARTLLAYAREKKGDKQP